MYATNKVQILHVSYSLLYCSLQQYPAGHLFRLPESTHISHMSLLVYTVVLLVLVWCQSHNIHGLSIHDHGAVMSQLQAPRPPAVVRPALQRQQAVQAA